MVHPRFYEAIAYLFPSAKLGPLGDILVQDDGDGKGRQLLRWDIPAPIPTDQQVIDALATIDSDKATTRARVTSFLDDVNRKDIVTALTTASPSQLEGYIRGKINAAGVTNLTTARACLSRIETAIVFLAKAVALSVRGNS